VTADAAHVVPRLAGILVEGAFFTAVEPYQRDERFES
jgi:hypothetical protein